MAQDLQSACKISRADIEALQLGSLTTHEVDLLRSYLQVLLLQQVKEEIVEGIPEEEVTRANSYDDLWKYRPDFHDVVRHIKAELLNDLGANPSEYLKAASRTRPPQSARRNKAALFSPTESINMRGQDDQVLYEVPAIDPGTVIRDRYKVIGPAGAGGMSTIYLAEDMHLDGRKVAIKMIRENLVQNPAMLKHFNAQVKALVKLDDNPHVVNIEDRDSYFGIPFVVMEYVDGFSLRELLSQNGSLSNTLAANYAKQVAEGLAFVHDNNILHLDVKPSNILIKSRTDTALLSDFDISWNPDWGVSIGGAGTPAYMPPEQFESHDIKNFGPESDIFALGATLYHMVTGQPPYGDRNSSNYLNMGFRKPHELNSSVDSQLESIILHCMQWNKADRYHSASDLAEDLASYLNVGDRVETTTRISVQEGQTKAELNEKTKPREEVEESSKWPYASHGYHVKNKNEKQPSNYRLLGIPITITVAAFLVVLLPEWHLLIGTVASVLVVLLLGWHFLISARKFSDSTANNFLEEISYIDKITIKGSTFTKLHNTYYYSHNRTIRTINGANQPNYTELYKTAYGTVQSLVCIDENIYYLCRDNQNDTLSLCQLQQTADGTCRETLIKSLKVDNIKYQTIISLYWYNDLFYLIYFQDYKDGSNNLTRRIMVISIDVKKPSDIASVTKKMMHVHFTKDHPLFFCSGFIYYSDDHGNMRFQSVDDATKAGFILEKDLHKSRSTANKSFCNGDVDSMIDAINVADKTALLVQSPMSCGLLLVTGIPTSKKSKLDITTILDADYEFHVQNLKYTPYAFFQAGARFDTSARRIYFTAEFSDDANPLQRAIAVLSCKIDGSDLQQCASASLTTNSYVEPVFAENGRVLVCLTNGEGSYDEQFIEMNPDGTEQKIILQQNSQ